MKNPIKTCKIYAVDFDGTICDQVDDQFVNVNNQLINFLISEQKRGCRLILWTCRTGARLNQAIMFCMSVGLQFDAVNDNLPALVEQGINPRKVIADVYIDTNSLGNHVIQELFGEQEQVKGHHVRRQYRKRNIDA